MHTVQKEECGVEIPRKIITMKDIKNLKENFGEVIFFPIVMPNNSENKYSTYQFIVIFSGKRFL